LVSGTPPTVAWRMTGTMSSPWPPSTSASTSRIEHPTASATKHLKREVSSTPAMPHTMLDLKPVIFQNA
jgi:hypothetical protein